MADSPRSSEDGQVFGLSKRAVFGALSLVGVLILLGVGIAIGRGPVPELRETAREAELAEAAAADRAESLESRLHGEQALTLLYRALLDVDARNFGIANERVRSSTTRLEQVDPVLLGMDPEDLESIRAELATFDIRVAEDLAAQRARLTAVAERLNQILGEAR
ncbi:MAG: hypothetical protein EA422_10640 [Gemmatimonadales bacterium]|nr:MAG: hypothetical protein EA422_10640 [Gemmatimonadales bacterium]